MSQTVDQLKKLLFDNEARELSEISRKLDLLLERAGTDERFTISVANVLDGALRKAEVDRHGELADAVAPLIVRTVKTEIRNSRDELVDALYPVTGRIVKSYVASAMKDLANDINRRLESNPIMLRLRSLTSGKSVAEIAMAESQQLRIEELYLVRRGSGELVGRWPDAPLEENRDHVMSGILTAINEFSSEALQDEGTTLRQIDIGERQLYLRASQGYLLAAKCSGVAPAAVESILDEAFISALEDLHKDTANFGSLEEAAAAQAARLGEFSKGLDEQLKTKQSELSSEVSGVSPLKLMGWMIGLPLALWASWLLYANYRTERVETIAARVVQETAALKGYPTELTVGHLGNNLTIAGLAPSASTREQLIVNLQLALPRTTVRDQMNVIPNELADIEPEIDKVRRNVRGLQSEVQSELKPEIERALRNVKGLEAEVEPKVERVRSDMALFKAGVEPELARVKQELADIVAQSRHSVFVRAVDRANRRLAASRGDVVRLETTLGADAGRAVAQKASVDIKSAIRDMSAYTGRAAGKRLEDLSDLTQTLNAQTLRLRRTGIELSGLISDDMAKAFSPAPDPPAGDLTESAEALAAEAERLSTLVVAVTQALALKKSLPVPKPTPREKLEAWTRANAIFFANGTDYREAARAEAVLDQLAGLIRTEDGLVRIVGYTDGQGGQDTNSTISEARARKVAAALESRGVPTKNLVALGRLNAVELSPSSGDSSPNRRVQFEVGFVGEAAQ